MSSSVETVIEEKDENISKVEKEHKKPSIPEVQSTEVQLGILEYLNPNNPGFPGAVIKQRYSDFNVTEIDKTGQVVRLDSSAIPNETPVDMRGEEAFHYTSLTESQKKVFSELQFNKAKILNNEEDTGDTLEIDVTDRDKNERREIHTVLKRFDKIDSNTLEKDNKKLIVAKPKKDNKGGYRNWPRDRPRFLNFSLYKDNCETFEAIGGLAAKARVDPKHFSYAGTKDKRARTLQRVSVSMTTAKKIMEAAAANWKVEVGNFSYEKNDVKLGDLKGNRFTLAIRNLDSPSSVLEPVMNYFKENGFINYFGTQRFGTSAGVPTSTVGRALLSEQYSEAIDLILKPREYERIHSLREAKEVWANTKDAQRAFSIIKKGGKDRLIEGRLLYGLSRSHKNDKVGALEEIPPHQRSLYCHAFQSLVWNKVVSRRIRTHGQKVLKGDLVYKKNVPEPLEGDSEVSKEDLVEEVENPADWSFTDILIPIPGCRVKWPSNQIKDWFTEELSNEGVNWDCFQSSIKTYNMPGDYRHPFVKATEVKWECVSYTDTEADILPSLKEIHEKERNHLNIGSYLEDKNGDSGNNSEKTISDTENRNGDKDATDEDKNGSKEANGEDKNGEKGNDEQKPEYSALLLSLNLPSSTYATMALREILRVETDKASLTKQNDYKRPSALERPDEGEPPSKLLKMS